MHAGYSFILDCIMLHQTGHATPMTQGKSRDPSRSFQDAVTSGSIQYLLCPSSVLTHSPESVSILQARVRDVLYPRLLYKPAQGSNN